MAKALLVGLTGGIGSGKSTVAALLAQHGAAVIDADAISRSTTAAGGSAVAAIAAAFGPQAMDAQGAMNRPWVRELVFRNSQAKQQLEAIIHPMVGQAIAQQVERAQAAGVACIVLDIPLLVESAHWRTHLQRILVVDCQQATQIQRVQARSGMAAAEVERIIRAQASRAQRLACADVVLVNDTINLSELALQVQQLRQHFGL